MAKNLKALRQDNILPAHDDALDDVAARYSVAVTDSVISAFSGAPDDPVARQYLPDVRELETTPLEREDPIGDHVHSPVKGIVHRYPDRALLMPLAVCAVYCRFCFRREMVGQDQGLLTDTELDAAFTYIERMPALREIILTGGDPLVLSPRRLSMILERLAAIPHIDIIRIHSRVPVADPARIGNDVCAALEACPKPVYIAVHVNHANELIPDALTALKRLRKAGAIMLSQTVLLKDVNDNLTALENLFRALIRTGVKPYYLHHPDLAPGTGHFRVPPKTGQALMRALRGRMSGLGLPTYVLDIPGGHGKVPIGPTYLHAQDNGTYTVEDWQGAVHIYKCEEQA